jgi:hypothetical protein
MRVSCLTTFLAGVLAVVAGLSLSLVAYAGEADTRRAVARRALLVQHSWSEVCLRIGGTSLRSPEEPRGFSMPEIDVDRLKNWLSEHKERPSHLALRRPRLRPPRQRSAEERAIAQMLEDALKSAGVDIAKLGKLREKL